MVATQRSQRRRLTAARLESEGWEELTPFAIRLLQDNIGFGSRCVVVITSNTPQLIEARVTHPQSQYVAAPDARRQHIVSFSPAGAAHFLPNRCSCLRWRDMDFPCAHACATMLQAKIGIRTKISDIWGNWATNIVYTTVMHPISLDDLQEVDILPPHHYTQKGFVRKKRMEVGNYYNPVGATVSQGCSGCGEGGHNIQTCEFRQVFLDQL